MQQRVLRSVHGTASRIHNPGRSYGRTQRTSGHHRAHRRYRCNDKLHRDTEADRFITLGCCLLDRKNALIEFARAGHTDLISFIHRHIRVTSPDGTALGILPGEFAKFDTICTAFQPGTSLMMFSDGLSEALNKENEEFGMKRLVSVFEEACREESTPQRVIDRVFHAVGAFEVEQNDDQTIVLIRHIGAE